MDNNYSKKMLKILQEKTLYLKFREEINTLNDVIKEKDIIINKLKNNIKASKFKELNYKYAQIFQELNEQKNKNEKLENVEQDYLNIKKQAISLLNQLDFYKKQNKFQKEQIERLNFGRYSGGPY